MRVTYIERSSYYARKKTFAFLRMVRRAPGHSRRNSITSHSQTSAGFPQHQRQARGRPGPGPCRASALVTPHWLLGPGGTRPGSLVKGEKGRSPSILRGTRCSAAAAASCPTRSAPAGQPEFVFAKINAGQPAVLLIGFHRSGEDTADDTAKINPVCVFLSVPTHQR